MKLPRLALTIWLLALLLSPAFSQVDAARTHFNRGVELQQQGDLEGARQAYEAALKLAPQRVDALSNLGLVYLNLGGNEKAIAYFGKALALMHDCPDQDWSVDDLAREVGLSRSALHERFVQCLGQPPMQYLASWRMQLGARLLRESNRNVAAIALDVGYDSEAAFSRAFKRMVGVPPAAWRKAQARA